MVLIPGARIGPYEIVAPLGAGGMGEVYRARDTKLNREVAVKVLLPSVADDPDRLARFSREAQLLASLNHPNIAHIHGLEESGGTAAPLDGAPAAMSESRMALVMELVEGPTLADRIAEGPIPLAEALPIAKQLTDALEAAHDRGIIHRDLKPANIKLTGTGSTVKVLDFGLAKAMSPVGVSGADVMSSPTVSIHATQAGIILGTAAYMSPEQAKGRPVDKRTDLWAFGAVFFEMLTGRRPFGGDDVSDALAHILLKDVDWTALPPDTPASIRKVLRRCLEKDRHKRIADAADVRLEIEEALATPTAEPAPTDAAAARPAARRIAPIAIASLAGGAIVAAVATWLVTRPPPFAAPGVTRFVIAPSPTLPLAISGFDRDMAISPDGTTVVYRTGGSGGANASGQLFVRRLDQLDAHELVSVPGRHPFFSPDGRWIGFFDSERNDLKKAPIAGGPAISLCRTLPGPRGASWGDDDSIVFTTATNTGLLRVPAGGGDPQILTTLDAAQHERGHFMPSVLPGGRGVLFTVLSSEVATAQVAVLDLKSGQRKTLVRGGSHAEYIESSAGSRPSGYLVYAATGTLLAVRFDLARLEVIGDPVPVVDHLTMSGNGAANFASARNGTLVYLPDIDGAQIGSRQLVWVDRKGHEDPIKSPLRAYSIPSLSPDGKRVALYIADQDNDIWTLDLARQTLTRLTFDSRTDLTPVWTPDSRRIFFSSVRTGATNVYSHAADGTGTDQRLTASANTHPVSVTPDGKHLLANQSVPNSGDDIVQFTLDGAAPESPPESLLHTAFGERNPVVSPDGRYLAYESNESGRFEVYARPYPHVNDGRWQVSTAGGVQPVWARSGRELFFLDRSNTLMSLPVETGGGTFTAGSPTKVFDTKYVSPTFWRSYDISPDGQRLLMIKDAPVATNAPPRSLVVVEHWIEELKAKLPAR